MNETPVSAAPPAPQKPRDAATLIILRRDGPKPRVLMGKRHAGHAFMPNKFVFPGGRVDAGDLRVATARDLEPAVVEKLMARMRGRPSPSRARALALAAVRETFEEAGLILGRPAERPAVLAPVWAEFGAAGYAPDLAPLRLFARAITPPGRTRRFDTRFFVVEAENIANLEQPVALKSEELLDLYWFGLDEAAGLELPWITSEVLRRLGEALPRPGGLAPGAPVTFQFMRGKQWLYETL